MHFFYLRFSPPIFRGLKGTKGSSIFYLKQVGDFGLSRLKRETYLTTKTGKGTVLLTNMISPFYLILRVNSHLIIL